jgi:uroporphyrinogen decarboxylase
MIQSWGIERFSYLLADEPGFVQGMMDQVTDWNIVFHQELCERDLDFVYTGHDLAHTRGTFMSPRYLRTEVFPREKAVAQQITRPWIYHCCGDFSTVAEDIMDHGCSGIDPFQPEAIDIVQFKARHGHRVCVKGNVSMDALMFRTPDAVEREVRDKIAALAPGGGYIISSAHSIYGACKPENVVRMARAIRDYGTYPISS